LFRIADEILQQARFVAVARLVLDVTRLWLDQTVGVLAERLGEMLFGKVLHGHAQLFVEFFSSLINLAVGRSEITVSFDDQGVDKKPAGDGQLLVSEFLGLFRVPSEAGPDEQKGRGAKEKAALPLQARLTQYPLEYSILHRSLLGK